MTVTHRSGVCRYVLRPAGHRTVQGMWVYVYPVPGSVGESDTWTPNSTPFLQFSATAAERVFRKVRQHAAQRLENFTLLRGQIHRFTMNIRGAEPHRGSTKRPKSLLSNWRDLGTACARPDYQGRRPLLPRRRPLLPRVRSRVSEYRFAACYGAWCRVCGYGVQCIIVYQ